MIKRHSRHIVLHPFIVMTLILSLTSRIPTFHHLMASAQCIAPESTNKSEAASFWCSMTASIQIQSGCTTFVTETFILPWTTEKVIRWIPHQTNQRILNVKGFFGTSSNDEANIPPGIPTNETLIELISERNDVNSKVTIFTPISLTSIAVSIQYIVVSGVIQFISCNEKQETNINVRNNDDGANKNKKEKENNYKATVFPPLPISQTNNDTNGTNNNSRPQQQNDTKYYMVVRWAMGGLTIERVEIIEISFAYPKTENGDVLDHAMYSEDMFKVEKTVNEDEEIVTTFRGNVTLVKPSHIIAFLRFWKISTSQPCNVERDCFSEIALLLEGNKKKTFFGLIILAVIGSVVLALVGLGIYLWIRKVNSGDEDPSSANVDEGELPRSLHHFAYDTGDEVSSFQFKAFTPRNGQQQ